MAPPTYSDLGKPARDVFGKGYTFGLLKLDIKTKTESGVDFASGCISNTENGKVTGSLETKYKFQDYGVTLTERWNTDNVLATDVTIQDQLAQGLKLSIDGTFAPQSGNKTANVRAAFMHDKLAFNLDCNVLDGPLLTTGVVLGHEGFVAGYQNKFNANESKVVTNNFSLGYSNADFILHTAVNNGELYTGSIFQRVKGELDAAVDLSWTSGSNDTIFGIGGQYRLDSATSVRAKVNNLSQVGLGYQQKLRQGVTLTLSALIDAKNFNQGGHKIGIALDLEA